MNSDEDGVTRRSMLGGLLGMGALSVTGSSALADTPTVGANGLLPDEFEPQTPVESHHPGEPRFVAVGEPLVNPIWTVGFDARGTPGYDDSAVPGWALFDKGRDNLGPRLQSLSAEPREYDETDFAWSVVDWPAESSGPSEILSFTSDTTDVPRYDGMDTANVAEFRADAPGWYTLELAAPDGTHELTIYAFERGNDGGAAVYRGDPDGAPRIELDAEYDSDAGEYTIHSNPSAAPAEESGPEDIWTQFIADDRDALATEDVQVADEHTATVDEAALGGDTARVHAAAYDQTVEKKSAADVVEVGPGGDIDLPGRPPEWIKESVMYQIFPRSWAGQREETTLETLIDGTHRDGSAGADGIDYLEQLGVDVVWITPIVPAVSVQRQFASRDDFDLREQNPLDDDGRLSGGGPHGYDTAEYTGISQDLSPTGDPEEALQLYEEFVEQCNERGIRVLFDLVINHGGITNPLFQETIAEADPDGPGPWPTVEEWNEDSPYFDWWDRADVQRVDEDGNLLESSPRTAGFAGLQLMPNLNYDNLALREYILGVADFWSREVGVDGFRADIAYGVPHDFWKEMRELVRANDSEFLMFDESVPRDAALSENMFSLHHDTAGFMTTAHRVAADEQHGGSLYDAVPARKQDGIPDHSLFINALENHDEHRILNQAAVELFDPDHDGLTDDQWEFYADRVRKCFAASVTMPGVPHLYYGQERQISRFGESRHLGPEEDPRGYQDRDARDEINVSADVRPGGRQRAFMNWDEYDEDHLDFYKDLISFYKEQEVLHPDASFEPLSFDFPDDLDHEPELLLFGRDGSGLDIEGPDQVAVLINFRAETETVSLTPETETVDLLSGEDVAASENAGDESATIVDVDDVVVLETTDLGEEFETVATWDVTGGTDDGPGWYEYPTGDAFNDGAFDVTGFEVRESDETVQFAVEVADLQNVWDGENGFSLQYPHIFVQDPGRETDGVTYDPFGFAFAFEFEQEYDFWVEADGFDDPRVFTADQIEREDPDPAFVGSVETDGNEIHIEVPKDAFEASLTDVELAPLMFGEDQGFLRAVTQSGGEFEFEDTTFDDDAWEDPENPYSRHYIIDAVTPNGIDNSDALAYDPETVATVPLLDMEEGAENRLFPGDLVVEYDGGEGTGFGPGNYIYPQNLELPDGSIDVQRVTVYESDKEAAVAFEFAPNALDNQFDLDGGFSHPVPQVYIRNPESDAPGTTEGMAGTRVTLDGEYQYHIAADGDGRAQFEDAEGTSVGSLDVQLLSEENTLVLRFSTDPLDAPLAAHELAVAVSAFDGFGPAGLRDVTTADERQDWVFAGADTENAPRVLDIVTPGGVTQEEALSATDDERATIPFLSPAAESPPPVVDEDSPRDLDGDGYYEDVDGDGELTTRDLQVLFENRDTDVVQDNASAFNFSETDDSRVTLADIQALYRQL